MKKLLATTAMCIVLGTGLHGFVNAGEPTLATNFDVFQPSETLSQQNILVLSTNMYHGDFQQIARSVLSSNLYAGDGSAQMGSIRMFRY